MTIIVFLALLGPHSATAVNHSLKCLATGSSQVLNFPEYVGAEMVDDVHIYHYDSNTTRVVPKQDWMNRITEDYPKYWESETEMLKFHQQFFKARIETLKLSFNHTGGVHILQVMHGCEWNDETGEIIGYERHGYDGEEFISLDLKTEKWITRKQQAVITKQKWDNNKVEITKIKKYLTQECPDYLKKFVNYGRSSLMRTDLPSVSLLQKTPSSPVRCFATGFYPDRAEIFWRKDGEEIHENMERGEILPNHDGSFQMNVDLNVLSVTPEDWRRYECVFQLSDVKDNIITKLDKTAIQTNWCKTGFPLGAVIGPAVVLLLLVVCIVGYFLWKKNKGKDGFQSANSKYFNIKCLIL
ncbi:major histocompatibility complex class I-related gene protein-like [Scomber scombrus]|uniref:Major histocompatibility complex class I-related gene protein-like n=1 Tax=Scomber scombrus TaxID=13677 RepID=A0AAV1Q6F3_SCOSC